MGVKRRPNGRWEASWRDAAGRERVKVLRTRAEADRYLAATKTEIARGDYVDPTLARTPLRQWADEWLATMGHIRLKTRASYESDLRTHILPRLGDQPIGSIRQSDVKRFVAELAASGAAPGTVRNARKSLRQVFNAAQAGGAVRANPCDGVRVPTSPKQNMAFLTPEEVQALSNAIGPHYGFLICFAAYTGLRAGELDALRSGRVDLRNGRVLVAESVTEVPGHGLVFSEPKTYQRRSVTVPGFLLEELEQRTSADPEAFVFTTERGEVIRHKHFYRYAFKRAVVAAGLGRNVRFHDLRHTCASLCIALGAHPKAIQERLGHSSITVTLDRYGHLFPKLDEALTDRLSELGHVAALVGTTTPADTASSVAVSRGLADHSRTALPLGASSAPELAP